MCLSGTYPSQDAAESALIANGFAKRDGYFAKPSKVDDWYGGYAVTAIVHIEHRHVDPQYGAPDYYELRFA